MAVVLLAGTTVGCASPSAPPAPKDRNVAIYATLLVAQLSVEPHLNRHVYVLPTPAGATKPLEASTRDRITDKLRAHNIAITWGTDTTTPSARIVTLPQIPTSGRRFTVAVTDWCGDICGHGLHYIVQFHDDRWTATQTGGEAIS